MSVVRELQEAQSDWLDLEDEENAKLCGDAILEIESLAAQNERNREGFEFHASLADKRYWEIESLTAERDRLREALEFYSNQKDWDEYEYDVIDQVYDRNVGSKLGHDAGKIARETLKGA